jgi:hypothetical protein
MSKADAWAMLAGHLANVFREKTSFESALDWCREQNRAAGIEPSKNENDSERSPLAVYLSRMIGYPVTHGGLPLRQWVGTDARSESCADIRPTLPE